MGILAILGLPGGMEWIIILVVVLLLFGPKRLPQLGKSVGKTVKAIRDGVDGKDIEEDDDAVAKTAKADATASKKDASADDEEA